MKCDCGEDLIIETFVTSLGTEVEVFECPKCGVQK